MDKQKKTDGLITADKAFFFQNKKKQKNAAGSEIFTVAAITEHKRDEDYIQHLAAIVESSDDAIISKSLEGIIKSWNKGSERMFGYLAKDVIGKNISLIIPPEYIKQEINILERIRNNEIIDHYETVRNRKDGEQLYVSLTVSSLKDRAGNIISVSKIARDITSQKKSEAALIHANKELAFQNAEKEKRAAELIIANKELAFQNKEKEKRASELIIANTELVFQNEEKEKRAAELIIANRELDFQNKEKEKRALELIIANTELVFQNEEKEKRAAELIIANRELDFQNKEKEKRAVELTIAYKELAFQNEAKKKEANKLLIANRDLKLSEEQFKEVNKELEAFSYSVSHDLRAPLRAVHGYAKMLKENFEALLDPEANRFTNNIMNNAKRMGQLIDDLLNFSRIGRKELVKMNVPMKSMVTNICSELKNEQNELDIEFHIGELLPAQADTVTIRHVWLNLISNAIKYSGLKEKAVIEIGSEIKGNEIIYHIKDNGAGFDMRYAGKLFGVFQRLHSDEEFEGTGVGLALVSGSYLNTEAGYGQKEP